MGLSSTLIYTSGLILCSTICVPSATRHNIHMHYVVRLLIRRGIRKDVKKRTGTCATSLMSKICRTTITHFLGIPQAGLKKQITLGHRLLASNYLF